MRKTLVILSCLLIMFSLPAWAENFTVEDYTVKIDVGIDGTNAVSESLDLDFHERSHGIFRDIQDTFPLSGEAFPPTADVENITVSEEFETERNEEFLSIRIGSGDVWVEGPHHYDIGYDFIFRWDPSEEFDQFYYNIVSPAWATTMDRVRWEVSFPAPVDESMIWVTRGGYGESGPENGWTLSPDGMTITGESCGLDAWEGITLRVEMPEGYFSFPEVKHYVTPMAITFIVLAVLYILWAIFSWWQWGNDDELIVPVRFDPPEGMTPLDCGFIVDGVVDFERDILPMMFYWADKGYMKIEETGKGDFKFTKLSELSDDAKPYEQELFSWFFDSKETVDMSDIIASDFSAKCNGMNDRIRSWYKKHAPLKDRKADFHQNLTKILGLVEIVVFSIFLSIDHFGTATSFLLIPSFIVFAMNSVFSYAYFRNWHVRSSLKNAMFIVLAMIPNVIAAILLFTFLSIFELSLPLIIAVAILHNFTLVAASFIADASEKRSEYGNEILRGVLGFREFLDKVEVAKLDTLVEEDPEYFYHNLAYAACFDLTDRYVEKFKDLAYRQPEWLVGNAVDYMWWRHMYRDWSRDYVREYARVHAPSGGSSTSSGSSGFSGGGFSGGGGRSW